MIQLHALGPILDQIYTRDSLEFTRKSILDGRNGHNTLYIHCNREVHQSVPGTFEEFQSQNLSIGGLNQAIYVLFTVRISIKFLMPRDISEMSPRQPNMPGLREQMLTWTETKTSLTCYCEHKLHHTQTKFR